jgi:small subunit ribosomal protein S3Ae
LQPLSGNQFFFIFRSSFQFILLRLSFLSCYGVLFSIFISFVPELAKDSLKGRVYEIFLADLNKSEETDPQRKMKLRCEDVQGADCLTNFYGMSLTSDKIRSSIKKWQTLIEAAADVKTLDGYVLRVFCMATTNHPAGSIKKTAYAQAQKVRQVRKKMIDIMRKQCAESDLRQVVMKFQADSMGKQIKKEASSIFPLNFALIRKVKVIKSPKFEVSKLLEFYTDTAATPTPDVTGLPATEAPAVEAVAAAASQ